MADSFCSVGLTPSCMRVFARILARANRQEPVTGGHLVLAVLAEESVGSRCLVNLGVNSETLAVSSGGQIEEDHQQSKELPSQAAIRHALAEHTQLGWAVPILERANLIARQRNEAEVSTEDLVEAMTTFDGPLKSELETHGITSTAVAQELGRDQVSPPAISVDIELNDLGATPPRQFPELNPLASQTPLTIIDANLNRCREGLRVLDDVARFFMNSAPVTRRLKELRHAVVSAERSLPRTSLLRARNVENDAGTHITTTGEATRKSFEDIVTANARRVQESLRSLEEFGKLIDADFAMAIKNARYQSYELEQQMSEIFDRPDGIDSPNGRRGRLQRSQLYLLITEQSCALDWKTVVQQALEAGADVIQLREKLMADEELTRRASWLSSVCKEHNALSIINDRADLVLPTGVDGVHVGQEDDTVESVRQLIGEDPIVGLSTHNIEQLIGADTNAGVDYLGVGPVFPSSTKTFSDFAGPEFVSNAAANADKPWFAIGGIGSDTLSAACEAGATRVAVCNVVLSSRSPGVAVREIVKTLRNI